ncbi:sugar ABC transporter substrate-binding protein [Fodinicurvata sp. EGI_FJ10296]|uniref:ABC transporter substrate-binding protein n=1 Tax=Fodinicurvata sp. EGI_FJ10296 TaxID=3231908 RepID=UPI003452901F
MRRSTVSAIALTAGGAALLAAGAVSAQSLTIATVNNSDMIIMQELSTQFEEETGIELDWVVLEENVLRQRVTTDIATGGGQFDIITIGAYETPIWGQEGWLEPVDDLGDDYDYDDLLDPVRNGLSHDGTMYAVPFYAESSFTFYRTDLFEEAGLEMPDQPTYDDIRSFAETLHDPDNEQYGICLRGKPGWGENMAYVSTLVNTFGGRWFDMDWEPQLDSAEWSDAINFYVDLLGNYGPPGAASNGHNENRALFASGNCAMWIDATSAAGYIFNPSDSEVADVTGFTAAPTEAVPNGAGWSWSWALGIPSSSQQVEAAKEFLKWATSKEYVELVGETQGWTVVPPGTRASTYEREEYLEAAPFAEFVHEAILAADPSNPTADEVPYTGVQFVAIPEFQGIGTQVGQSIAAALSGQMDVEQALQGAQSATRRTMDQAGYYD